MRVQRDSRSHRFPRVLMGAGALAAFLEMGMAHGWPARKPAPTFSRDVAPILYAHCLQCHGAGELVGNEFPITTYAEARARDTKIKEMVVGRKMPPWPVDPAKSLPLRNDPRLNQNDIDTIAAWVDAGSPKGKDADLPPLPSQDHAWLQAEGREPSMVISLPGDMHLPAAGAFPYQQVLVKVPFAGDRWVVASAMKPTNPAVVHHMALTEVTMANGMTADEAGQLARQLGVTTDAFLKPAVVAPTGQPDMLAIYTPGSSLETYADQTGKLLRGGKDMYLVFNIHYQAVGTPQTDRSQIALWFSTTPPAHQIYRVNGASETIIANGRVLLTDTPGDKAEGTHVVIPPIPPFDPNYELTGITGYPEAVTIWGFHPHAHYRAKDFAYIVVYPDGREETVLSVPHFHHHWQMAYELAAPLHLPAGSKLVVEAHYDNSKEQEDNPAPQRPVFFRSMNQSWDEMFTPFIQYSVDDSDPRTNGQAAASVPVDVPGALKIEETVGSLQSDGAGKWSLTQATEPVVSRSQVASADDLKTEAAVPLGSNRIELLGIRWFGPEKMRGEKVAVRGVVVREGKEPVFNVTSLVALGSSHIR